VVCRASLSKNFLLLKRQSITVMLPAVLNVCTPSTCGPQSGLTLPISISSYVSGFSRRMRLMTTAEP